MGDYRNLDWRDIASLIPRSDDYAWKLYKSEPIRRPYILDAIEFLRLPVGSSGLDAGCGIGLQTMLLADAVGRDGHVTGLDISQAFLARGKDIAQKAGYEREIDFKQGDIYGLPFEDDSFDWIWSADCAGYQTRKPVPLIRELARVVRPGGIVSILVWSSQQLLPGYPLLEAHLNATASGIAPFTSGMAPEMHYLRALGWFESAGLEQPLAHSFVGEFQAPLEEEVRTALLGLIEMRWPDVKSDLAPEERELFERLTCPGSPECIVDVPGYYAFFTETLFCGRVPA